MSKSKKSITGRGTAWEVLRSWWIALSFVALAWVGFIYIAIRTKEEKYGIAAGVFFFLQAVLLLPLSTFKSGSMASNGLIAVWVIAYIFGIVLSFLFRKEYLIRMDILLASGEEEQETDALKEKITREYEEKGVISPKKAKKTKVFKGGPGEQQEKPKPAAKKKVELPKEPQYIEPSERLDINTCSELELINLPGFTAEMAKRVVNYREMFHGFLSLDEFYDVAQLKPHLIVHVQGRIKCEKPERKTKNKKSRKLDF